MSQTKYVVKFTTQFRKDYKLAMKRGLKIELLERVIMLIDKATLRWNKIQEHLKTHDYIMNADVRELCGVSATAANRILVGLATEKDCQVSGRRTLGIPLILGEYR